MNHFHQICIILLFRLFCWCLVTSSFNMANLLFGALICSLIPFGHYKKLKVRVLLPELLSSLRLPFDMLKESLELMMVKAPKDTFVAERVSAGTRIGSRFAEFLDLFRITFTPMSLVVRRMDGDHWLVHKSVRDPSSTSGGTA